MTWPALIGRLPWPGVLPPLLEKGRVAVPHRSASWVWVGRVVAGLIAVALVAYLADVGLDTADKVGSVLGMFAALAALVGPYLLPGPPSAQPHSSVGGE